MKRVHLAGSALCLLAASILQGATDLNKLDRTIGKEPRYTNKPQYCLLAFGPEATRVWIVLDGKVLYCDRLASGNLDKPENRVLPEKSNDSESVFAVPDVVASRDGAKRAKLTINAFADWTLVTAEFDPRHRQTAGTDREGNLHFASTPKDAPVIHFGGPMLIQTNGDSLHAGRTTELYAMVGTPGIGPGSFAAMLHENLPKEAHLEAELQASPTGRSQAPLHVMLDRRCCGWLFHGPVAPDASASDPADVTLWPAGWDQEVAPARARVKIKPHENASATDDAILNPARR